MNRLNTVLPAKLRVFRKLPDTVMAPVSSAISITRFVISSVIVNGGMYVSDMVSPPLILLLFHVPFFRYLCIFTISLRISLIKFSECRNTYGTSKHKSMSCLQICQSIPNSQFLPVSLSSSWNICILTHRHMEHQGAQHTQVTGSRRHLHRGHSLLPL